MSEQPKLSIVRDEEPTRDPILEFFDGYSRRYAALLELGFPATEVRALPAGQRALIRLAENLTSTLGRLAKMQTSGNPEARRRSAATLLALKGIVLGKNAVKAARIALMKAVHDAAAARPEDARSVLATFGAEWGEFEVNPDLFDAAVEAVRGSGNGKTAQRWKPIATVVAGANLLGDCAPETLAREFRGAIRKLKDKGSPPLKT